MPNKDILMRALYMVLFAILHTFTRPIIILIAILQYLHVIVKNDKHPLMLQFGHSISQYVYEIVSFLTFNTEEKPFPFGKWPQ